MSAPVTVALATLGCRLNQVESQEIGALLEGRGFRVVEPGARAQVYVINTCTVTGRADFSDRQLIRRIARENPEAYLVVTGCFAQTDPEAAAAIAGVDLVVGNQEKYRLPELLGSLTKRARPEVVVAEIGAAREVPIAPFARVAGRSRAFVKIQDGCQHRCAFCIVPAARGRSRSQEPKVVVDQVRTLAAAGYLDVTLTGVDIGHYGWDLYPRTTLAALLRELAEVADLRWLRLSSVLPSYFTPDLVDAVTTLPVMAPHLHLPLQSGSDRVLRLMRRPYHTGMYRALVDRLAAALPLDLIAAPSGYGLPLVPVAELDPSRLDLALLVRNLVDNAIGYTAAGGRVDVEVRAEAGDVMLTVRDTGIGIPTRDLPRVFERFYRVDRARSRATGGTGLGLAIVKHVAENHGGTVTVTSELGAGTTFVVRLPRERLDTAP